jgi:hypothetical protein
MEKGREGKRQEGEKTERKFPRRWVGDFKGQHEGKISTLVWYFSVLAVSNL